MMSGKLKTLLATAVLAGGTLWAGSARAVATTDWASLIAYGVFPGAASNNLTDINGENLVDAAVGGTAGVIDVGDYLYGVLDFNRISNTTPPAGNKTIGNGTIYSEMTGIFLIQVVSKTLVFDPTPGAPNSGDEMYNIAFGPNTTLFNATFGVTAAPGTMVQIYDDFSQDFSLSGVPGPNVANSILSASNGSLFWEAGFTGAAGEAWMVTAGSDQFFTLASLPYAASLGTANFALNRTSTSGLGGNIMLTPGSLNASVYGEFVGSSTLKGTTDVAPPIAWGAASQTNFSFFAVAPLPSAAFMGAPLFAGMIGFATLRRRSRSL